MTGKKPKNTGVTGSGGLRRNAKKEAKGIARKVAKKAAKKKK
jgi:hypothetical protein